MGAERSNYTSSLLGILGKWLETKPREDDTALARVVFSTAGHVSLCEHCRVPCYYQVHFDIDSSFSLSTSRSPPVPRAALISVASAATQVAGVSAGQYVRMFEWDYSKFAVRQRLPALVSLIQGGVGKIEEEHRNLSMIYAEKNQALQVQCDTHEMNAQVLIEIRAPLRCPAGEKRGCSTKALSSPGFFRYRREMFWRRGSMGEGVSGSRTQISCHFLSPVLCLMSTFTYSGAHFLSCALYFARFLI